MFLSDPARPCRQFLQMQPWFDSLEPALQERLLARATTLSGGKGEVLLHAGEPVNGWYAENTGGLFKTPKWWVFWCGMTD